ncbi:MAG: TonB-dependent receptor [Elusimicrobia bacterium]|nr:TonB-dependent receptor [Elusimicrobiota bacterium]
MVKRLLLAALLSAPVVGPAPARAENDADQVFKFFAEESNAVTALRRPAATDRSPLAVDVITADEIRASGALDVWDLLRFRVGLDVITARSQAGYDRAVVSVRGIPRDSVTELRVMLDGRPVNSALDQGVIWNHIPVQIQDVDRVEIVRGPNAALYGSGAGSGVINIITRRPSKSFEASATALGGTLATRQGEASVEAARDDWGVRVSASDRFQGGFPKADGSGTADDWLHKQGANARTWYKPAPDTDLEFLVGAVREGHGLNATNDPQVYGWDHYQTVKLTQGFDGGSSLEARVSRTDDQLVGSPNSNGNVSQTRWWRYESEAFHSVPWWDDRMHTSYGIDWKYEAATADELFGPDAGVKTNRTVRGFLHQEVRLLDSLSVLGGFSNETANAGGWHKDFQVAALWSPLEDQSFRASYSRANMKPGLQHRHAATAFSLGSPGVNGILLGNPDLKPSPLTDYEAGWMGRFLDRKLETELTGYYMYIQDHFNLDVTAIPPGYFFAENYDNTNTLQLRGLEASVKWKFGAGRSLYANFSRETVTDQDHHTLYIATTPKHKANLGFDASLPRGFRLSANAGWKDAALADSNTGTTQDPIRPFWRFDARAAWSPCADFELFVSGMNLFAKSRREYIDGLVVPRTVFTGATVRY